MIPVTESKIRLTALLVSLFIIIFLKTNWIIIPVFLTIDFFLRAFGYGRFSILSKLSTWIAAQLKLPQKPVFFPPKQFAAKIRFLFTFAITTFAILDINTIYLSGILLLFAILEAGFNFCAGCYIYNLFYVIKHKI